MKSNKSISVGIAAHNEENNILRLLDSVFDQKGSFSLEKIYVECDGTTDKTREIVAKYSENKNEVTLNSDKEWLGKSERLNRIFEKNQSDILIILDADILLGSNNVFDQLVSGFTSSEVVIVSSNNQPLKARNFWSRITKNAEDLWYEARKSYKEGANLYNNSGCCVAFQIDFTKSFKFPKGTIGDQQITYLNAINQNKKFVFKQDAVAFYATASSLHDILKYLARSNNEDDFIFKTFGKPFKEEFYIPRSNKIKAVVTMMIRDPLFTPISIVCLSIAKLLPLKGEEVNKSGRWNALTTTKRRLV